MLLIKFMFLVLLPFIASAGHFENYNQNELKKSKSKYSATVEYEKHKAAIVDYQLITDLKRIDIAKEIVDAKAELWVRIPKDYKSSKEFKVLNKQLKALKGKVRFFKKPVVEPQTPAFNGIWSRDWAPVWVKNNNRNKIALADFNYVTRRPTDDLVPQSLSKKLHINRMSLPLYFQGGNFQTTKDGICFTNEDVLTANAQAEVSTDLIFNEAQVRQFFIDYLGCQKVVIFPYPEYEGLFHIDMWMMLVGDRKVVVSSIDQETKALAIKLGLENLIGPVQAYLEDRKNDLINLGFKVVELPWPITQAVDDYLIPSTYTNFQILNGHALVPSYSFSFLKDGADWKQKYETKVSAALKILGLEAKFLNSDDLIKADGSIHCVINSVPSLR